MTDTQVSGTPASQLKQLMTERVNHGLGVASKAAGQQAGVFAQAVRQTGEQMREQGQDSHGKIADRIAQPIQRMSGTLSSAHPDVTGGVKQVKPVVAGQVQQLKTQTGAQIKGQAQTRSTQLADRVTAVAQGVRQVGEQLRAQDQTTPALVIDVVAEKLEPVAGYLSSTDPDQLTADVAAYRAKAQSKVTDATDAVDRTRKAAAAKGTAAAKSTVSRVRSKPALPVIGALSAVAFAANQFRKSKAKTQVGSQPSPVSSTEAAEVATLAVPQPSPAINRPLG